MSKICRMCRFAVKQGFGKYMSWPCTGLWGMAPNCPHVPQLRSKQCLINATWRRILAQTKHLLLSAFLIFCKSFCLVIVIMAITTTFVVSQQIQPSLQWCSFRNNSLALQWQVTTLRQIATSISRKDEKAGFLLARVLFRHLCVSFMWKVFHLATHLVNAESKEPQNISEHHSIHSVETVPEHHSEQYRHHLWQIRLSKASKSIQTTKMIKEKQSSHCKASQLPPSDPSLCFFDCYQYLVISLVSIFARTRTKELNANNVFDTQQNMMTWKPPSSSNQAVGIEPPTGGSWQNWHKSRHDMARSPIWTTQDAVTWIHCTYRKQLLRKFRWKRT